MSLLHGKKILLGITGSIAAYKSATLVRLLVKSGAEVKVIMTSSAEAFISSLTLSTLSGHEVHTELFEGGSWNNHVELGLWADMMLMAPLTANSLGKMANGICDNILLATYLSAKCPVLFAPAMDLDMWAHPSTQYNVKRLESFGNKLIPVGNGFLASGLEGEGRMAEPEDIITFLEEEVSQQTFLTGKSVVVTAGPTYEPLDPVRFIGNHSSGKMGYAIVDKLLKSGANVILITGPTKIDIPKHKNVEVHKVTTAVEMFEKTKELFPSSDITIFAAAVADYTPKNKATQKIKKQGDALIIELVKNPDIAKYVGKEKKPNQISIGFALETQDGLENAKKKIKSKNLDMIVLNTLGEEGVGFNYDTNKVTFIMKNGDAESFELKNKSEIAKDIINQLSVLISNKHA